MSKITVSQIQNALTDVFKLPSFRTIQQQVIERLCIDGKSCALIMPTGGGKSLTYQLPSVILPHLTLVVSPLIALMKDQVDALKRKGVAAASMDSTLSYTDYIAVANGIRSGSVKILYVAPERLNNESFISLMKSIMISLLAIDESHCVSEWGHSFRPDYLKLARFRKEFAIERVLCLTATATETVCEDICSSFGVDKEGLFKTSSFRENLYLHTHTIQHDAIREAVLVQLLTQHEGDTIVYSTTQNDAESIARFLKSKKFDCAFYHAGMKPEERSTVQDWFMYTEKGQKIVCATIAFGMGIDKSNIRNVIHYKLPKTLEGYSQEIGRAGRDGLPSHCSLFLCPADVPVLQGFIRGDTPSRSSIRMLLNDIFEDEYGMEDNVIEVSKWDQERMFDIKSTPLGLIYAYLELHHKLIRAITPKYSTYKFKPLVSYKTTDQDSSKAGQTIKAHSSMAKTWANFDLDTAMTLSGLTRAVLLAKLNEWAHDGHLEVSAGGVRNRFILLQPAPDATALDSIADKLSNDMVKREAGDIARLKQVIDFATHEGCLALQLAAYFGETLSAVCGKCSYCTAKSVATYTTTASKDITKVREAVKPILKACDIRDDANLLARLAYGISTPRLTNLKLTKDATFGSLENEDYEALVAVFEEECAKCNHKNLSGIENEGLKTKDGAVLQKTAVAKKGTASAPKWPRGGSRGDASASVPASSTQKRAWPAQSGRAGAAFKKQK